MFELAAILIQCTTAAATVRGTVTVAGDPAPLVLVDSAPLAAYWDVSPRVPADAGAFELASGADSNAPSR